MTEEDHTRARGDCVMEELQHIRGVLDRLRQRDHLDYDAVPLRLQSPRLLAAGVFLIGHQHFVTGLHFNAVGDVVICFGCVTHERQFVARASDKCCHRVAICVVGLIAPNGIVLGIGLVHLFSLGVAVEHGAQNRRGTRSDRSVIEIDLVFRNQKLLADFSPISIVTRKLLRIGQRFRPVRQLGK